MAAFDPVQRQIVVRVVYDGVGHAGKTTNLQQLMGEFTPARRGELVGRDTKLGRTLFFDWLQLEGGRIGGYSFRSEVLTVPGQSVLRQRRLYLLHKADVVVLVVDSTPDGVREGIVALEAMQECLLVDQPPLIVQANKQDLGGALAPQEVRARLGLPDSVPVVGAVAAKGVGVRETALLAMRHAARALTSRIVSDGPESLDGVDGVMETPDTLYADMQALQDELAEPTLAAPAQSHPDGAKQSPRLAGHSEAVRTAPPRGSESRGGPTPREGGPAPARGFAASHPRLGCVWGSAANQIAASSGEDSTLLRVEVRAQDITGPDRAARRTAGQPGASGWIELPLPSPAVPSNYIWPGAVGRETLRKLPLDAATRRDDLTQQQGKRDGSGKADTIVYRAGDYCLKTSLRKRFTQQEPALAALLSLARRKRSLGELLPASSVLVLQPDSVALWLWTVSRWTPSLRADMARAEQAHAYAELAQALVHYAHATFDAIALVERGVALDINPSNFARDGSCTVYLDDDIDAVRALPVIGYAWLKRVDEYAAMASAVERYVAALEQGLVERVSAALAAELGLASALEQTLVTTDLAKEARSRLLAATRRCKG